jgi:hypothetical protein
MPSANANNNKQPHGIENNAALKTKLVKEGVKKLRVLGFRYVNEENILSDEVYKIYFGRILESLPGNEAEETDIVKEILQQIKQSFFKSAENQENNLPDV